MPIILIVDDSQVDQRLVAGMIKKDIEWIIEFANDGKAALDMMETIAPHVVITDLMMPNMDGIELVRRAKTEYPQIPFILMTGQGSEALAIEALQAGAASYVPKSALADCLMDTIDQVLQMADLAKSQNRLCTCMTHARFQFKLTNDPVLIPPLITFVTDLMARHDFADEAIRRHAGVALEEALINAMFHGNLELAPSQVQAARRAMHAGETCDFLHERRADATYSKRRILVGIDLKPPTAQFIVRDEGPGFDVTQLPPIESLDSISSSNVGRGLNLIGHLMDQIEFNAAGNQIRMALSYSGNGRMTPEQ